MEPKQGAPRLSNEGMSSNGVEARPAYERPGEQYADNRPEVSPERPARLEAESLPPVITATPTALPTIQDDATQSGSDGGAGASSNPVVAGDEDLIEKEWVDKAKNIIEQTKADPYRRELEIGKLQRDYIRKRYGREIGESGDL